MQLRPVRSLDTHGSAEKIHRILEAAIAVSYTHLTLPTN